MTPSTPKSEWLSSAAAQRETGIKRYALEALQEAGVIARNGSKVHVDDLAMLKKWREVEYVTGKKNLDLSEPVGFAVPLTDTALSPHLELSEPNGAAEAREAIQEEGITLRDDQFLSGWWNCHMSMVDHLVETRAPLVGVTGGFVTSGAWIDGLAMEHPRNLRKAFIVTCMTVAEIENFRGSVPGMNQTGTYFSLQ